MAAEVTVVGPPIVAGEVDCTLIFNDLALDWAAAGYTLKLEVTAPNGTETEYDLAAVSGDVYAAKLVGVGGMFPTHGIYTFKIIAYSGATRKRLTEDFSYQVQR